MIPTLTYTPVPGQSELYYDDGGAEKGFVASPPGGIGAVRFYSLARAQVLKLKFNVWGEMRAVKVHVLDADFNSVYSRIVMPSLGWFEVDISDSEVFVDGHFYVGWEWISESPEGPWLGVDTNSPHYQGSWLGVAGEKPQPAFDGNYMIRAVMMRVSR